MRERVKLESGSQMTIKSTASPAQVLSQVNLDEHCDEFFPGSAEGVGYIHHGWYTWAEASGKDRAAFRLYLPFESSDLGTMQSVRSEADVFHCELKLHLHQLLHY